MMLISMMLVGLVRWNCMMMRETRPAASGRADVGRRRQAGRNEPATSWERRVGAALDLEGGPMAACFAGGVGGCVQC